jgi:ATP-dependent Clp protease ATP-binding subunit ClpX
MKNSELYDEIAIIFRRTTVDGLYDQILYKPIKCVYCEKVNGELAIVDSNNTYYNHLICGKLGDAYALRISVKDIMNTYNLSNPDDAKNEYFNYINDLLFKILYTEKEGLFLYGFNNKDEIIARDQDFEGIKLSIPNTDIEEKQEEQKDLNATELSSKIKEKVIGQDSTIDELITIIWTNDKLKSIDAFEDNKLNILLIGNSGVGKTFMIRTLAKQLNKDVYFTSANNLSQTGYQGNSVTDILSGLIAKCQGDINRINNSIVFIDEIDKISANKGGQISTESVQQELLTMLEGGEYYIKSESSDSQLNISTKNITFICAGAFDGIRKKENKSLGFNNDISNKTIVKITPNDIENYGFIPELVGRLPIIIELNNLTKEDIINILKSKNGILESLKTIIEKEEIELIIDESTYEEIANKVIEYNLGARGIRAIVINTLAQILDNINKKIISNGKIIISKETVINPNNYEYIESKQDTKKKVRSLNENN